MSKVFDFEWTSSHHLVIALVLLVFSGAHGGSAQDFDILIRGGMIVDVTGGPEFSADVGRAQSTGPRPTVVANGTGKGR